MDGNSTRDNPGTTVVVPISFHQLGILVLDGSGSMAEMTDNGIPKYEAVALATRELLGRLKQSAVKKNFSIAIVTFDDYAKVSLPVTRVYVDDQNTIDEHADYNPMNGHGGGTDLAGALKLARNIGKQFLAASSPDDVPYKVVTIVMSDGMSHTDPTTIASEIKNPPHDGGAATSICSCYFDMKGEDPERLNGKQLLLSIASSPINFATVWDSETLRDFFTRSVAVGLDAKIQRRQ